MFILNTVQLLQKTLLSTIGCISIMDADSASLAYINMNKKTQLSLTNLRDAKACQNCSNSMRKQVADKLTTCLK